MFPVIINKLCYYHKYKSFHIPKQSGKVDTHMHTYIRIMCDVLLSVVGTRVPADWQYVSYRKLRHQFFQATQSAFVLHHTLSSQIESHILFEIPQCI